MAAKKEKIEAREKAYIILNHERYQVLEDMVCEKIAQHYRPIGGVATIWGRNTEGFAVTMLYQAMEKIDSFA